MGLITAAMATLSLNEWAVLIGIGCTLVTCGVNWYYERRRTLIAEGVMSGK
ncbi:HP1 family phage holin [Citrobacter freundii]|uniref:HP1 family phage holin n=1 Tax=Citrobacter freundii TaxID=546 RepID=UPI003F8BE20D